MHAALHLVDDAGVVRGHDHGGAAGVDAGEQLHDAGARGGVEVSGRLVGEQDLRLVDDGAGDRDALLLTAGELVREGAAPSGEADHLEGVGHGLLDEPARLADHLQA